MKNRSVLISSFFIVLVILYSCHNDFIDDSLSSNSKIQVETKTSSMTASLLTQPEFINYADAFEKAVTTVQNINSKKDLNSLQNLNNIYQLCKEQPEEYLPLLEANISSLYTNNEMDDIKEAFDDFNKAGKNLSLKWSAKSLSEDEKELLNSELMMRNPEIHSKIMTLSSPKMKKNRSENQDCIDNCEENYHWALLGIASGVCLGGIGAILETCGSLGTLSIPALLQFMAGVAGVSVSIDIATATYKSCLKTC